jgi:hypothetical protein
VGVAGGGGGDFGGFVDLGWRGGVSGMDETGGYVGGGSRRTWITNRVQLALAGEPGFLGVVRRFDTWQLVCYGWMHTWKSSSMLVMVADLCRDDVGWRFGEAVQPCGNREMRLIVVGWSKSL